MSEYFTVKEVREDDVTSIGRCCAMAERYASESRWDITLPDDLHQKFKNVVYSESSVLLYVSKEAVPVGFAVVTYDGTFSVPPLGILYMFYILPSYRATQASIRLISGIIRMAKLDGCKYLFASTFSMIDERTTKAFDRMLERQGFEALTPCYMKELV